MARRKILVLENEYLLIAGLISLMSNLEGLEVMTTKFTSHNKILKIIDSFRPDAIVMDEERLIGSGGTLIAAMKEYPKLRIIVAHWDENQIEVYENHRVEIKAIDDLLAVI